jgi:hypothetical protein
MSVCPPRKIDSADRKIQEWRYIIIAIEGRVVRSVRQNQPERGA